MVKRMALFDSIKKLFGGPSPAPTPVRRPTPPPMMDDEPEPVVPEVSVPDLLAEIQAGGTPTILDIREIVEWNQVRVPGVKHIPMNTIPQHLDELDRTADLVIMCAHGNRSYSVTAWLNDQGFTARNLKGGITMWNIRGGTVETGKPS